jgi:selenocysteine-specific elongation factor
VQAGDRAALNLAGFKQKDFSRGLLLADQPIKPTTMIDVKIRMFDNSVSLGIWNQLIFLQGTVKQMVRVHLLDRDTLASGEKGLAQIYLPKPIVPLMGDKFILRISSGDKTLGGGEVIDPYPLHHRRRRSQQIEIVKKLSSGDLAEIIAAEVRKSILPVSLDDIAKIMNQKVETLTDVVYEKLSSEIAWFQSEKQVILLIKKNKTAYKNKILNSIRKFHDQNPLMEEGRSFQELLGVFGEERNELVKETLGLLMEEMEGDFLIRKQGKTWVLYDHSLEVNKDFEQKVKAILDHLWNCGYNVPLINEIETTAKDKGISDKELKLILQQLTKKEEIVHYQGSYLHSAIIRQAQAKLVSYLKQHEDGISLAQYRDLLGTNRKMASILLEYFDKKNITIRRDNIRQFTAQYRKYLKE